MFVAEVRGWGHLTGKGGGCAFDDKKAMGIQDANARLIAAAPELLDFVKAMHVKHAPTGDRQRCLACGLDGNCCGTYLVTDKLIAKAEGK